MLGGYEYCMQIIQCLCPCVIQGWLKCEDTACGARLQKLPLMFQRGHPVCSSCNKGILHPEVCFFT